MACRWRCDRARCHPVRSRHRYRYTPYRPSPPERRTLQTAWSCPGIGRRTPTQRPIPGIERVGIFARARSTDVDDAIGHPRSSEEHMWRREMTHARTITPFLDQLLGRLHKLSPAHLTIAGIHCVQMVEGGHVERLLFFYRSTSGHHRNRCRVLTPVQSHLIQRGRRILVHGQGYPSEKRMHISHLLVSLSHRPAGSCGHWESSNARLSVRTMSPAAYPYIRMPVCIPIGRCLVHRLFDL
jgi:hypothetical protein